MPGALIISSFVAKSRVGGVVQMLALNALGVEAHLVPSVVFGRHPGLGPPGGGPVDPSTFSSVLAAAEASGALDVEVILTGYFASAEQVAMTADAIERAARRANPPLILIDPILGDDGPGLYVKPEVEIAIRDRLVPLADILAPNLWELQRLTGASAIDPQSAAAAARRTGRPVLVSSVPCGIDRIGVLYVDGPQAWLASHARAMQAPRGTGDLLKALYAVGLIEKAPIPTVLVRALGGLLDAVDAAAARGSPDLLIAGLDFRKPVSPIEVAAFA